MSGDPKKKSDFSDLIENLDRATLIKILDHCSDEIFVTNKDGVAVYVNPVCERNYGLKVEDILGKKASNLVADGYCFPAVIPEVIQKMKRVNLEQKTSTGKDLLVTATPILNARRELDLIVQNSRDVTQLGAIREDLLNAKQLVKRYREEVQELRKKQLDTLGLIAHSRKMRQLLELCQHVATTDSTVLILGESGTGKGVLARYVHKMSQRREGPFITINCAAIPATLLETELFGYDRGTFTGADKDGKIGLIELANEGTLFLDEIAEIPLQLQAKLLDVIQERQFMRVGGRELITVDVRIIAATNRDLHQMVKEKKFRNDLYYRLNVIEFDLPPLRQRRADLMPLIYLFLNRYDKRYQTHHQISQRALDVLLGYAWPGNIRELEHVIERLVITVRKPTITLAQLPAHLRQSQDNFCIDSPPPGRRLDTEIEKMTRAMIVQAYGQLKSSYKVAQTLGISQSRASRLIRRYVARVDSSD